jgi:RNA polymerase sigma-70 factor, ECF subfamily
VSNETEGAAKSAQEEVDWKTTVQQIRDGDPAGEVMLYRKLVSGARIFLRRRLRIDDVDDRVHDVFLIVIETIRRGELREPERLMGFVRTVLNRQVYLEISRTVRSREKSVDLESALHLRTPSAGPEEQALEHQKVKLMMDAMRELSDRDFEVLTRFYLHEQTAEHIRAEMRLTKTQFDLLKARAKVRLMQSIRRKLTSNPLSRE